MRAERVTDRVHHHGEGPAWHPAWRGVRWVDMLAGAVLELDPSGTVHRREVGTVAAMVRPLHDKGWVVARADDLVLFESEDLGARSQPWVTVLDTSGQRLNEGGCDPQGNLLIGSMEWDAHTAGPVAGLYRVTPSGQVDQVLEGVTISNGLEWSPDGNLAYYVDTPTRRIDVFDHDPEQGLVNRRPFAHIVGTEGRPDGLTVDRDGGVWVAITRGGAVRHYDPAGTWDALVEVGADRVTAVTLGDADLRTLYITTTRQGISEDADPAAGSLFACRVDVPGQALRPFAAKVHLDRDLDEPSETPRTSGVTPSRARPDRAVALRRRVGTLADRLDAFSRDLFDHPELGYHEFHAVEAFAAALAESGITIERNAGGIPTAFTAQLGSRSSGPQVAITAEYDALPDVGHGCGHNVIAASSLGAFLALVPLFTDRAPLPGGVTLIGTPAEEGGGGKELLIQAGVLDGYDAAVMVHPGGADVAASQSSAKRQVVATFTGRTAHAAANPHLGRNALDAAVSAYQAIAQLRQHMVSTDWVHGVFLEAGTRPNIVPERAVLEFFVRSRDIEGMLTLSERVQAAFQGAALAAGVEVAVVWDGEPIYLPHRINEPLARRYAANLADRREIEPVRWQAAGGSSDIGNVSQLLPTIQPMVAIGPVGIPGHSRERADSTLTPDGRRAIVDSAVGLAQTAADVLTDDLLRAEAWAAFAEAGPPIRVADLVPVPDWPDFPTASEHEA